MRQSVVQISVLTFSLTFASACTPPAQEPAAAPPPAAAPERVYISDETGGNIVIIDGRTAQVLQTVAVGKRPRGLRFSRDGRQLLVALSGSPIAGPGVDEDSLPPPDRAADGIGILDLAAAKVVKTLHSGQDPETFDTSLDGTIIYVSNEDAALMTAIEIATGAVKARVKIGEEPEGVTLRPDGRVLYVTCEATNDVAVIDVNTLTVITHVKTGARPRTVVFTPDSATAFVTNENDATVSVMDARTHAVTGTITFPAPAAKDAVPARPMGAVLSPDARTLYVSLGRSRMVGVIDVESRKVVRTIADVGLRPWGIGVSADGRTLFTANGPGGDVSIIDVESGTVRGRVATGGSPWGIAVEGAK